MTELDEENLVEKAKKGDAEAFTQLASRYQVKIFHTILGMTGNRQDADDLAQEAFLRAYKSLQKFDMRSGFYTWIYRIAVNVTLNHLKKMKRVKAIASSNIDECSGEESLGKSVPSPETHSLRKELSEKLREAINSLPFIYRTCFILVVFQEMNHSQAAKVLSCSENTVSWRMHMARKMLQDKLKTYIDRSLK